MTQTLFLSQLRNLALIVIAYCAGRGWLSSQDSGAITAVLVPVGAIAGPWIWSIYVNLNSRLVHVDSAAAKVATIEAAHPIDALNAASRLAEKVATVLLLAFVISAFLAGDPAMAQTVTRRAPQITGDPIADIKANLGDRLAGKSTAALDSIATVLAKPFQDIADFIGADADGAVALSTAIPTIQDGHGQQCGIAMQSFGAIIKAHPVPITFHVINDYESLRLLAIATNNLCSNVHCTQFFSDFTAMAQAASPLPLAIPSLHDLCTKVPQIAVVPPISVPVAATAPVPDGTPAATPAPAKP
jgi:hypothetical protein